MPGQGIDAVFENGVIRPLRPVCLPEHQRVMLVLLAQQVAVDHITASDHDEAAVAYEPLPLEGRKTIRVRLKRIGALGPVAYPIELGDPEEA
jgi:predicted DNA-binding antitoxin AbrB/MazE fold protein